MSYADKTFEEISREVAEDFLNSVVVVDDQAYLHASERVSELKTPTRRRTIPTPLDPEPAISDSDGQRLGRRRQDLDAKTLIDTFASSGLVCAVLRPEAGDGGSRGLNRRTDRATQRADIVILDWRIRDEELAGTTTLQLINTIVGSDEDDRLRLIAIYTGEPDLAEIADKIGVSLENLFPGKVVRSGFVFSAGSVRVSLYAKSGGSITTPDVAARTFSESDLPKELVKEFAATTQGLLSNVALKSLAALRGNTHRLLRKFNDSLDAPYLAHRALMSPSEEAEHHPIPLLSSEVEDVLEDRKVSQLVSPTVIKAWLDFKLRNGFVLKGKVKGISEQTLHASLLDLIEHGIKDETASKKNKRWAAFTKHLKAPEQRDGLSKLTEILTPTGVDGRTQDMELALLMSVKTQYEAPSPLLTLGTIVAEEGPTGPKYLLCVQPPCDGVRFRDKRSFPFLRLTRADGSSAKDFDVIVRDGTDLVPLRLSLRPYDSRMISFKPRKGHREVRASRGGAAEWLFSADSTTSFRWIADLKPAQAQRVANLYGATIARVGLTESEWLRRMAKSRD